MLLWWFKALCVLVNRCVLIEWCTHRERSNGCDLRSPACAWCRFGLHRVMTWLKHVVSLGARIFWPRLCRIAALALAGEKGSKKRPLRSLHTSRLMVGLCTEMHRHQKAHRRAFGTFSVDRLFRCSVHLPFRYSQLPYASCNVDSFSRHISTYRNSIRPA